MGLHNISSLSMDGTHPRVQGLDALRGVAIALVVIGHIVQYRSLDGNFFNYLFKYIYIFHMPLFFFISGLVFKVERFSARAFYRSLLQLFVPWFFWTMIVVGFYMQHSNEFASFKSIFYLYWFFPVLILCHLILFLTVWLNRFVRKLFVSMLISSLLIIFALKHVDSYLYSLTKFHFLFVVVGIYAKLAYANISSILTSRGGWYFVSSIFVVSFLVVCFSEYSFDGSAQRIIFSIPLLLVLGLFFSQPSFCSSRRLEIVGRYSLEIYTTHIAVIFLIKYSLPLRTYSPFIDFVSSAVVLSLVTFMIVKIASLSRIKFLMYGR